jgi:hypothetical protein
VFGASFKDGTEEIIVGSLETAVGKIEFCIGEIMDGNKEYSLLFDGLEGIVLGAIDEGWVVIGACVIGEDFTGAWVSGEVDAGEYVTEIGVEEGLLVAVATTETGENVSGDVVTSAIRLGDDVGLVVSDIASVEGAMLVAIKIGFFFISEDHHIIPRKHANLANSCLMLYVLMLS